ncbi:selenide, water dikinase SelD [Photobacterium proteolyticum]|uniref:Selenide, water dikinase n=2 Tax=Photobacterium proteolyticum TaxID=1903952 RepID=A0A1Q9GI41_9GAMM|nr:selenide, water dikinase SelD [Photobacterium proteolyticum]
MAQVLQSISPLFPEQAYPDLMVGLTVSDDAAVYKITDDVAVIQTLDFFTPIVDDPYDFGAIAAANALSDVYAMGGQVTLAMNIFCVPSDLPQEIVGQILKGGAEKVREAGAVLVGGHTVEDDEPKFGLSVMGTIHPSKVQTKAAVDSGDILVLTKPIGTGLISTAAKRGKASQQAITASTDSMKKLNRKAAEIFARYPVKACTDVTGYSLLGHALEMAEKSDVCMHFNATQVPFLIEAEDYAAQGLFPGGAKRNLDAYRDEIEFAPDLDESWQRKLCCPETSGGLLAAVPKDCLDALLTEFSNSEEPCWVVGYAEAGAGIKVSH